MNNELVKVLSVMFIGVVIDIIAGTLSAKQHNTFNKEKFIRGLYKGGAIIIVTFGLALMFEIDSTLTFNDTPLVDYLIAMYQVINLGLAGGIIYKLGVFFGVLGNEGE